MKKHYTLFVVVAMIVSAGLFLGFSNSDNPRGKASFDYAGPSMDAGKVTTETETDNQNGVIYYTDNFDGANDTNALKARDYQVYYRGSGPQGGAATWFQGNSTVFPAFNGPTSGYVGANYQVVTGFNNIDSWLVLPDLEVFAGDVISFRCRSVTPNPFPDSVRVMYNASGGSTPESTGWVELGRFLCADDGNWELKSFVAPSYGFFSRFAIRYCVVDGGPLGDNSNYIGIDALEVSGQGTLPVELSSFSSVILANSVQLNWTTVAELNNYGFDIERRSGETWNKIGFVDGNGTTNEVINYSFTDRNLGVGSYSYRLKQIDFNGTETFHYLSGEVLIGVPSVYELSQNYPNPFNPGTKINYQIPTDGRVNISVFDNSGREVANLVNEFKTAGYYTADFNASSLSSGVYFYRITSGNFSAVKKMMLVK